MSHSSSIGVIILAAGASRRLGRPKQLVAYMGKPLLQHVLNVAQEVKSKKIVLVLGAGHEQIRNEISTEGIDVIVNEDWNEGVASSIRCGLTHLESDVASLEHVMFLVSDQPFLTAEVIESLVSTQALDQPSIVASSYDGQIGVPAIFSHHFFDDLHGLNGDVGAKKVIMSNKQVVKTVPFTDGDFDIDTKEDYKSL